MSYMYSFPKCIEKWTVSGREIADTFLSMATHKSGGQSGRKKVQVWKVLFLVNLFKRRADK